jgi:hypothetical protein
MPHSVTSPGRDTLVCLWRALTQCLDGWNPDWKSLTHGDATAPDHRTFFDDPDLSDERIFAALTLALLSGNTRWDRIAAIQGELRIPFADFDMRRFAALPDAEIERDIVPWFRARKAGSAGLRAGLLRLKGTVSLLAGYGGGNGGARSFFRDALADSDGSIEALAVTLGGAGKWKLPGFGIALAAEALRNLGLDLSKPDRHVLRAIGAWSLVDFARWDRRGDFTPPAARPAELKATMLAVRSIAEANRISVTHANSAIWTAGAVSGPRLTNRAFEAIAASCR